jgi:transposase-like protein
MRRVAGNRQKGKGTNVNDALDSRVVMIQTLIPLALQAVNDDLQDEVLRLAGDRHVPDGSPVKRWGYNPGSVCLEGQKVRVDVPRLRDLSTKSEVPLESYAALRNTEILDANTLNQILNGMSQRKYGKVARKVDETFSIAHGSVSRRFIKASKEKLEEFQRRDLSGEDIVAVFIDGKRFAENGVIIALGVALAGDKKLLGIIESGTENRMVISDFISDLVKRGLKVDDGILFVIDGSKGIYRGVQDVVGKSAFVQRCQWHKRENVVKYLDKKHQASFRAKLQRAYEEPTYERAKAKLLMVRKELSLLNESAVASLDEGMEETLTLHRLGMFGKLGRSFKTTNCVENVNSQLGLYTKRVCRWQNSNMRQRWVASALLEIEPKLNKVAGYKHLKELREVMKGKLAKENVQVKAA